MSATGVRRKEQGFSLPEVLCALLLYAMVIVALSGYHRALQQGLQAQWQFRQLWRLAVELGEPQSPDPEAEWKAIREQTTSAGCVSIAVNITSPAGRSARLVTLHCPPEETSQE